MRNEELAKPHRANYHCKVKVGTERSEQKDQGHVPGQGQGVKPLVE